MDIPSSITIDDYISGYPIEVQQILEKIRKIIHQAAPDAGESICYGMPTFKLDGNLVHFAAFNKHIGLYPTPGPVAFFKNELADYKTAKGSIQFPLDKPVPYDLIRKIVEYRINEVLKK
jgi:uncharacterized protein YdhG (YjbR/CyaY superfamily)